MHGAEEGLHLSQADTADGRRITGSNVLVGRVAGQQRGDEAVDNVAKYIDEANLLSIKEVSILHGKGNGILRKLIREYLSKQSCIQSFNDASLETGGAGITRVTLK